MHNRIAALFAIIVTMILVSGCSQPQLRKVYTEHLGQLTGTPLNPTQSIGITGTDLGVSFIAPGRGQRLVFLFGDSWTSNPQRWDQDSAAITLPFVVPERNNLPKIDWLAGDQFTPIVIDGINLGGMNVPVEGLAIGGQTYIFASTGWEGEPKNEHCCSVLAHTPGLALDFDQLIFDEKVITRKFINISAFIQGDFVWLFGSGPYRKSDVFLARVSPNQIANRSAWQYFRGPDSATPWGPGEETAQPVVISGCVGELSVRPHPDLGYLMLYNCGNEGAATRGIHLRRADNPWGPWDPPINIFDPGADRGYGYFMHQKTSEAGYDDGLAEPGLHTNPGDWSNQCPGQGWREECWGGEYGPYLVPQWFTRTEDGGYSIVYTMSSWVPYQVHLMRTVLAGHDDSRPQPPPQRGVGLPPARLVNPNFTRGFEGWHSLGDPFGWTQQNGLWYVTTYSAEKHEAAMGALYQDFTVDANTKALRFRVHGGDATVRLHRGLQIVRETRGRSGHVPWNFPDTKVCWQLGEYAGERLRVAIFDGKTGPWGFIGVTGFEFLNKPCGA